MYSRVSEYTRGSIPSCRRNLAPEERLSDHVTSTTSKYTLEKPLLAQPNSPADRPAVCRIAKLGPRQTFGACDRAGWHGHCPQDGSSGFPRNGSAPMELRSPDKKSRAVENVFRRIRVFGREPSTPSPVRLVRRIIPRESRGRDAPRVLCAARQRFPCE